ncbi:hypothetical protein B0H14DRAFT_2645891 [Mycena olivaceomarginata]|nr:hypothetical protein B0H14DRAFT_2645891 [Mycena olivaceomarginata]
MQFSCSSVSNALPSDFLLKPSCCPIIFGTINSDAHGKDDQSKSKPGYHKKNRPQKHVFWTSIQRITISPIARHRPFLIVMGTCRVKEGFLALHVYGRRDSSTYSIVFVWRTVFVVSVVSVVSDENVHRPRPARRAGKSSVIDPPKFWIRLRSMCCTAGQEAIFCLDHANLILLLFHEQRWIPPPLRMRSEVEGRKKGKGRGHVLREGFEPGEPGGRGLGFEWRRRRRGPEGEGVAEHSNEAAFPNDTNDEDKAGDGVGGRRFMVFVVTTPESVGSTSQAAGMRIVRTRGGRRGDEGRMGTGNECEDGQG